jgi:hypothetical protein
LLRSEAREQSADSSPSGVDGPLGGFAEQGLELGEDLLDRIEIGTVGRQEEELGAGSPDGSSDGFTLVTAEIVEDDDVAWPEGGHEDLLDIGEEALAIDGTIDDAGRGEPVVAQGSEEGERAPAAVRRFGDQPLAARRATMATGHVGLGPGLVDEDQAGRINPALVLPPLSPSPRDVGPILLAGVQAFF